MSIPTIFSFALFLAFVIYVFLGIYALSLNPKASLNRVFFLMCLSLSIWAFCYSIANSAPDYETTLFWRRIASLGWGTIYAFMLHFFIILTGNKKILKNKWLYVPLYLPAVLIAFSYGINAKLAEAQYHLTNIVGGWVNSPTTNFWDWLYKIYYISFSLIVLYLLWKWAKNDTGKKHQATLLIATTTIAFSFGTVTDLLANKYIPLSMPQLAVVIILIPIGAMFYSIKHYGLMSPSQTTAVEPGKILSGDTTKDFYHVISMVFVLGGMLSFTALYFCYNQPFDSSVLFSFVLFIYGALFRMVVLLPERNNFQDNVAIFLLLTVIPLISLKFLYYANVTVWAIPVLFIIMSVVYNNRRVIFWLGSATILTQIWVWLEVPFKTVHIDSSDHIARIGILGLAIWLAFYINRIYIQHLEGNETRIKFQEMLSRICADFVKLTEFNTDEKINEMLKLSGEYFHADRTYLFGLSHNLKTYEWCNEGIEPTIDYFINLSCDNVPWWMEKIKNIDIISISDIEELSPKASKEKEIFEQHNIKSLIFIPLTGKDITLGVLCFASMKEAIPWQSNYQDWMKLLANILTDALVRVNAEKEISYMAYYDSLTGLPNRRLFKYQLEQAIYLARRTEEFIGVISLDLDSFKAVNDTMGHDAGDEVISQLAVRISQCLRKHDIISRFGGDEFSIMLTSIKQIEYIEKVTNKIMKSFVKPMTVKGQDFFVTASIGIAVYPLDGEDAETLIKNADLAMYASKDMGKKQYTLCSPNMKEDAIKRMQLTNSLHKALKRDEFLLYYQPQINVETKEIMGLEALIRWKNPELGMIPPNVFIPLAEQTGLIEPIGQWVLQTACQQNKQWQLSGLPPVRIAVNLSAKQLRNTKLINFIADTLDKNGLEAQYLELEITESAALNESGTVIRGLNEMKGLGVTIAIDDFGTEYSSLSRLKTLPVDRIKIDMQFVRGISESNKDEAITKSIIQLAKNLDLKVLAEGVETEKQFEFFEKEMCDEVQGYYFYKPMPTDEVGIILTKKL